MDKDIKKELEILNTILNAFNNLSEFARSGFEEEVKWLEEKVKHLENTLEGFEFVEHNSWGL